MEYWLRLAFVQDAEVVLVESAQDASVLDDFGVDMHQSYLGAERRGGLCCQNRAQENDATSSPAHAGPIVLPQVGRARGAVRGRERITQRSGGARREDRMAASADNSHAVEVRELVKRYQKAKTNAVDGVSFQVRRGEIFGLLGPNGAGKTTTIGVLITSVVPTNGSCSVTGIDEACDPNAVKQRIARVPQQAISTAASGYGRL